MYRKFLLSLLTDNQIDNLKCIKPSEVIKVLKKLNIKEASGFDCITNKMLINLPRKMIFEFTEIINYIFKFNYFPKAWKTSVVVPILQPGKDPTQSENYWSISLFSTLSKLTENFILDKLNKHLVENKILFREQFGLALTSTHQLLRVVEYITSGFEEGDVQKTFDRVWIQGLIHKLIKYRTPPYLLRLLKSYLEERKFAVKIGKSISEAKIMRAGIPQGGKISLFLYFLYFNDIPKTHKTLLDVYADDTAILPKKKNHKYTAAALNQHLAKLDDWFFKGKFSLTLIKQKHRISPKQQLLFTGTSSCSAPATTPQDPDGLPPTHPLPPTTASDRLITRTEIIQHHQRTITGD
ncbi:putative RNA-directed DNA polymerase from transposon BS [Araneus ventricosus]|uniref:Putative RNA-directed DNA polymerase from transposon BS n=1 Tax=Araneus ventricosus TaxID=182803 RepID=A0A4Y2WWW1_ARAVE|nr:putative RNA-directed DNA polymerase from transposon BS [Araneus ventricosus]